MSLPRGCLNSQDAVNDYSQQSLFTKILFTKIMTRCLHFYIRVSRYAGFGDVKFVFVFGCLRARVAFAAKPLQSLFSEATYRIEGRRGTIFLTLVIRGCQNPGIEVQR